MDGAYGNQFNQCSEWDLMLRACVHSGFHSTFWELNLKNAGLTSAVPSLAIITQGQQVRKSYSFECEMWFNKLAEKWSVSLG